MSDGQPWDSYNKGRIASGWAFPLGRDRIERALINAQARVGSLSFYSPDLPVRSPGLSLLSLFWLPSRGSNYFGFERTSGYAQLYMSCYAVPSEQRQSVLRLQFEEVWLPRGCAWAASSVLRGNAWSASEHRFDVTFENGEISSAES